MVVTKALRFDWVKQLPSNCPTLLAQGRQDVTVNISSTSGFSLYPGSDCVCELTGDHRDVTQGPNLCNSWLSTEGVGHPVSRASHKQDLAELQNQVPAWLCRTWLQQLLWPQKAAVPVDRPDSYSCHIYTGGRQTPFWTKNSSGFQRLFGGEGQAGKEP